MGNIIKCEITEEGRQCSQCWVFKIWDCFHRSTQAKLWHASLCKACCLVYKKTWIYKRESIENKIKWQMFSSKKPEKIVERMTGNHPVIEQKPYWDDSDMIEFGTNPHNALYSYIK